MWGIFTSTPDTLISSAGRLKPYNLRAALYMTLAISPLALLSPVKISSKTMGQVILFKVSSQSIFLLAARAEWCVASKAWCGLGSCRPPWLEAVEQILWDIVFSTANGTDLLPTLQQGLVKIEELLGGATQENLHWFTSSKWMFG